MWRRKKLILIVLAATVILAGSISGIALAQTGDEEEEQVETIFDKVTAVLVADGVNITTEQLENAFTKVKSDMRAEAMEKFMDKLVEEDVITQDEADEYLEWWEAKPDISIGPGFKDGFGFGDMRGRFRFGGMPRMHGFGGECFPAEPAE